MALLEVKTASLDAAAVALQNIGSALERQIAQSAKTIEPQWRQLLAAKGATRLERRVIGSTGRAVPLKNGLRLEAGQSGGSLSGGLSIKKAAGPVEYGADRAKRKTYKRRSRNGGSHSVTRRTAAQFRGHNKTGYVFGPAVKAIVPKLAKAWTEALGVTVSDAIEGKG